MAITIGVDLRCLPADGSVGAGVAHAARELASALLALDDGDLQWRIYVPRGAAWSDDARVVRIDSSRGESLRRALKEHVCDHLFAPSGAVAPGVNIPTIPWVHDIAIYDHPEWFRESLFRRTVSTHLFAKGVRRAPHVLCVSETTKQDLVTRFGLKASAVTATFEGGDSVLATLHAETLHDAKQRARFRIADRGITNAFVLFLGTLEPRKNLPLLLEAWLRAQRKSSRPVDLVIAGRDGWKLGPIHRALDVTKTYVAEHHSRLHRIATLSDDDRRDLLLAADLVAVPSLHEGFGLVAFEAMQAGTAILAANTGALPEVLGEQGCVLPPHDARQWAVALEHLLRDDESRQRIAEQGKARSQGMTWERTAKIVQRVLTSLKDERIVHEPNIAG